MKPRKEIIEKAQKSGAIDKASYLLALSYIAISEANNLIDEANEYLGKYGLFIGEVKKAHTNLSLAANRYFHECGKIFNKNVNVIDYFSDLEEFDRLARKFGELEEKFKKIDDEAKGN